MSLKRRKPESFCFFGDQGDVLLVKETKSCECTEADFECDSNFFRNTEGQCVLDGPDPLEPDHCLPGTKFMGSSGYRKISASKCAGGKDLSTKVERVCGSNTKVGDIEVHASPFEREIEDFFYFNMTRSVVMKDKSQKVFLSKDDGKSWKPLFEGNAVLGMLRDPYRGKAAYFLLSDNKLQTTRDAGESWQATTLPSAIDLSIVGIPLSNHPSQDNWLLFTGTSNCGQGNTNCRTETYASWDFGSSWSSIRKNALRCIWGQDKVFQTENDASVYCLQLDANANPSQVFGHSTKTLVRSKDAHKGMDSFDVISQSSGFAISDDFMFSLKVVFQQCENNRLTSSKRHFSTAC
jgi:hypothetical protein